MKKHLIVFMAACFLCLSACDKDNDEPEDPPSIETPSDTTSTVNDTTVNNGWKIIHTTVTSGFADISFSSIAKGLGASPAGLYMTTDSGSTWNKMLQYKSRAINIFQLGDSYAYTVSQIDSIGMSYSTDGGYSWKSSETILPSNSAPLHVPNVQFISPSTGFIDNSKGLFITTDTGKTWSTLYNDYVACTYFFNDKKGYIVTKQGILYTEDGGMNWSSTSIKTQTDDSPWNVLQFSDEKHAWLATQSGCYATTDGWQTFKILKSSSGFVDIELINDSLGYRAVYNKIYKTTDFGETWTLDFYSADESISITELFFVDDHHIWACCGNGIILRKFD